MTVGPSHLYVKEGLRKGVSKEILRNVVDQANLIKKHGLPPVITLRHLSHICGVHHRYLRLTVSRKETRYKVFRISKRSGGKRTICVPELPLLIVQKWIDSNILSKCRPHHKSFAFNKGSSIIKCAREHCGSRWLIKIDVKHFFESITEIQVFKLFESFGYQPLVAFELARLCTRQFQTDDLFNKRKWLVDSSKYEKIPFYRSGILGHVPQGSPTSPKISNLVCRGLDDKISRYAESEETVYTRYADDLHFSAHSRNFNRKKASRLIYNIKRLLYEEGFEIRTTKTVVVPPGARKIVLGLNIDQDRPRLQKDFKKGLIKNIWGIRRFGLAEHCTHKKFRSIWGFIRHIKGKIAYAKMVDPELASELSYSFNESIKGFIADGTVE